MAMIDGVVKATEGIPRLEPLVLTQFFWGDQQCLESFPVDDPACVAARSRVKRALGK
jgi:hypothetical protein